jgi:RHS repeat-associated protein
MTAGNLPGNSATNYVSNALGQLIEKSGYGGTIQLVYDEAGHLLGEYASNGALIEETIWMDDLPVATLRPSGSTVAVYYVHTDHLGAVRKVTRPSDNGLMWRWDPDTYGSIAANSNPAGLGTFVYNLGFPGQYYLPETGIYYNMYRDYDPQTGRYIESDPIGLRGGINTYAYVGNQPTNYSDPRGLLKQCRAGLAGVLGANIGSFRHEFQCWKGTDGKEVCRGYGRTESSSMVDAVIGKVPGIVIKGDENSNGGSKSCGADDGNKCMDSCAAKEWDKLEKNPPAYGLLKGDSCQAAQQTILESCSAQCHVPPPPLPLQTDLENLDVTL